MYDALDYINYYSYVVTELTTSVVTIPTTAPVSSQGITMNISM